MRIRKNAKISQLSISSTTTSPSSITKTHLKCQLNQSPWDIITFPPSDSSSPHYFQVDEDFGFAGNGSFGDSIEAIHSAGSMKSFMESEEILNYDRKWDFVGPEDNGEERETKVGFNTGEEENIKDEEDVVLCSETNGKGWQCGRVVKKGYKTCARHLKNCAVLGGLKSADDTKTARRGRGRPRNKKKEPAPPPAQAQNPYEFYYYSGFGPLWGKKKGPGRAIGNAIGIDDLDTSISKNIEETKRAKDEEIDYMECDDDDDDDEEEEESGKKRGRKRIKARSLKSLM